MKNVRFVALSLPLVLGSACAHERTGAMSSSEQAATEGPQDPMMQQGPAVQGHAGDSVVVGRIASASPGSVSIATDNGDTRTLRIVPQTDVMLDGHDASAGDLREGLPVQASFDRLSGQNVAVQVWAGTQPAASQAPSRPGGDDFSHPGDPGSWEKTQLPDSQEGGYIPR